jgi:hypothetical protein
MSAEDSLSSKILTNIQFIGDIYNIVNIAAAKAIDLSSFKNNIKPGISGNVNIVRAGIPNLNRYSADCRQPQNKNFRNNSSIKNCIKTNKYFIDYDENDIMIVGGAALNIYDYLLKEYKHRRGIAAMEDYIKKKTSDIDIVWWPKYVAAVNNSKTSVDNEIVVSTSPAIKSLVTNFKNTLTTELENAENKRKLLAQIIPFLENKVANTDRLNFNVRYNEYDRLLNIIIAGVHKVEVDFIVDDQILKIIDISIHDSGASQEFDLNGNKINTLLPMNNDPVYCTPDTTQINSIKTFPLAFNNGSSITVRVPSIYSLVEQQMFAFDNLIRKSLPKGFINYKRVQYIKLLLENWQKSNDPYGYIVGIPIPQQLNYITVRENHSINKFSENIKKMCKLNGESDKYIIDLCNQIENINKAKENTKKAEEDKIQETVSAEQKRKEILAELDRIYNLFYDTYKLTKSFNTKDKMKMYDLKEKIEKLKRKYFEMPSKNLIALNMSEPISKTKEVADLMEEERVIRVKIMESQRKVQIKPDEISKTVEKVKKVEEPKRAPNRNEIFDFNSEYYTTRKDGKPQYITKNGVIWYYDNPQKKAGLWRLNPYTKEWEQPDRKNPSYGLKVPVAAPQAQVATNHTVKNPILPPLPSSPPTSIGAVPLPPIAYSDRAPDGTIVHYTPQHIPWYIDSYGRVLIRDTPYGYRVIGQMPPSPPPVYHQQVGYFGASPAFASTGSRRGGTRKNRYRSNKTLKK